MKTTLKFIAVALSAALLGACSSSMQLSRTSSNVGDDLYYNPSVSYSDKAQSQDPKQTTSASLKLAELERKYTEILANDTTGALDTLIYENRTSANPYERILSDSYQDSYERRLRGYQNPRYGMNDWGVRYSDDFWYASGYDPALYNVIVMGTDVWVEPRYISAMFGWPYYNSRMYWGNSWNRNYMGFGFDMSYYYPYYGWGGYGYNSWYSPWNNYAWGYNSGFWNGYNYGSNYGSNYGNVNYHYGRRPGSGTVNYGNRPVNDMSYSAGINDRKRDLSDKQVTFDNNRETSARVRTPGNSSDGQVSVVRPGRNEGVIGEGNAVTRPGRVGETIDGRDNSVSTRPGRQDPQNRENLTRPGRTEGVVEPIRDRNNNIVTRPSRESLNVNPTRINPNDNQASTRPTREHNPSYTRPNPGNSNEFNRPTRNYPSTEAVRGGNRGSSQVGTPDRSSRQPAREYNPPPRTSTPVNTNPSRGRDTGSSSNTSVGTSRGTNSGSSSGSSGSSSSSGSSNTSTSTSGTRSR